ncbi:30 kDa heat shock protein [Monosporozyma servazzii]
MSQYIDLVKRGGNEALILNPPHDVDFHITTGGSDWLFAASAIFLALSLVAIILMFTKHVHERMHYYTAIIPTFCMSVAYFTMGSNLGWAPVQALYNRNRVSTQKTHLGYRQIFYARYIGWFLAFPWPVAQASLMGHTSLWHLFFNVFMTEVFVICYLVGTVVHSQYKWGYYTAGTCAAIIACISVMTTTRRIVKRKGGELFVVFTFFFGVIMFLWGIYPIVWGLCEGGNVLNPDDEAIWYGIMDCLLLGVMPCVFVAIAGYFGLDTLGYKFEDEESALPLPPAPKSPSPSSSNLKKKLKKSKK